MILLYYFASHHTKLFFYSSSIFNLIHPSSGTGCCFSCSPWINISHVSHFLFRYSFESFFRKVVLLSFNGKEYPRGRTLALQTLRSVCTRSRRRHKSPPGSDHRAKRRSIYPWQHSHAYSPCVRNRCNVPLRCIPSHSLPPPNIKSNDQNYFLRSI